MLPFIVLFDYIVADWFFFGLLGILGIGLLSIVVWFYRSRLKIGYKASFSVMINADNDGKGGVRKYIGEKEFKLDNPEVLFRKKEPFSIDVKKPSIMKYGWTYFDIDYTTGNQLTFGGTFERINPQYIKKYLADGLVSRVVAGIRANVKIGLVVVAIVVVIGVMAFAIGLFASPYILPQATPSPSPLPNTGGGIFG